MAARTAAIFVAALSLATVAHANTAGTLYVTSDATLTADHDGNIVILADNVTLNCDGHKVNGPGETGIFLQFRTNVTISHCHVTGFTSGIVVDNSTAFTLVENVAVANAGDGFSIGLGTRGVLRHNTAQKNGVGYVLENSSIANLLVDNAAEANEVAGFWIRSGSDETVLRRNVSTANGEGYVVESAAHSQLLSNKATRNVNTGYWVREASTGSTLTGNVAQGNFWGMVVHDTEGCLLTSNTLNHNGAAGINLTGVNNATVIANTSNRNGTTGIDLQRSSGNALRRNTANLNAWVGIGLSDVSSNNELSSNTARENGIVDAFDDETGVDNLWYDNSFGTTQGF